MCDNGSILSNKIYLKWRKSFPILVCYIIYILIWNNEKWTYLHIFSTKKLLRLTENYFIAQGLDLI